MKKKRVDNNISYFLILVAGILLLSLFLDNFVAYFFNNLHGTVLDSFFVFITNEYFVSFLIVIGFFTLWYKDIKIKYVLAIIITYMIAFSLKYLVNRPRPFEILNITPLVSASSSSFPSMHTFFIFAALPFIYFTFPKYKYLTLTIAILIAFSRIFVGVHYLSDVLFGATFGFLLGYYIYRK